MINPATEEVLRTVEQLDVAGVDDAVARAKAAQKGLGAARPRRAGRARCGRSPPPSTRTSTNWPRSRCANSGHPIGSARVGGRPRPRRAAVLLRRRPERLSGKQIPVAGGLDVTFHEPLGVVGVITPWNFPMTIAVVGVRAGAGRGQRRAAQAGRVDAADHASGWASSRVEAGLPADLFQVLPGKGSVVGERFVTHPDVRKIVFTGSTEVGTRVMAGAAAQVKRVTLELGGKSANIVFDDCDLEKAAATAPYGVFDNAGQDCCARSRILVQRNVYDRFMELLEPAVKGVVVGDPHAEDTEMGPLVSKPHWDTVASYVPDDAPVAFRGERADGPRLLVPADGADPGSAPTAPSPRRSSARS